MRIFAAAIALAFLVAIAFVVVGPFVSAVLSFAATCGS